MSVKKVIIVASILFLCQIIIFWEHLGLIQWGQIKVAGLACTCPDEKVVNGQFYLRWITPDSLKGFNIDYSEIYVTRKPSTTTDPMGVDEYIIKGKIIGKKRVSELDPWNLEFQVEEWHEIDLLKEWIIKGLLILQVLIYGILAKIYKDKKTY